MARWYLTRVLEPEQNSMILAYIGNICAALVSTALLIGTLRFTRRAQ